MFDRSSFDRVCVCLTAALAMDVVRLGKDAPCVPIETLVQIVRRSRWEVAHVAEALQVFLLYLTTV